MVEWQNYALSRLFKRKYAKNMPLSWVADQVREKYGATGRYPRVEEDALNVGIGCKNAIIIYLIYMYICNL